MAQALSNFDRSLLPPPASFYAANVEKFRARGDRATGLCPFHKDKHPSLSIDLERGLWHCFTCDMGGDVIRFIETRDRLSFKEAAKSVGAWRSEGMSESERRRLGRERKKREREQAEKQAQKESERVQLIEARDYLHTLEHAYDESVARRSELRRGAGEDFANETETQWDILASGLEAIRKAESHYLEVAGLNK
jgi:hypothetical protein